MRLHRAGWVMVSATRHVALSTTITEFPVRFGIHTSEPSPVKVGCQGWPPTRTLATGLG